MGRIDFVAGLLITAILAWLFFMSIEQDGPLLPVLTGLVLALQIFSMGREVGCKSRPRYRDPDDPRA